MLLKFLISFNENLLKDFRRDSRLDKKNSYASKAFENDYLILKEEYGI